MQAAKAESMGVMLATFSSRKSPTSVCSDSIIQISGATVVAPTLGSRPSASQHASFQYPVAWDGSNAEPHYRRQGVWPHVSLKETTEAVRDRGYKCSLFLEWGEIEISPKKETLGR